MNERNFEYLKKQLEYLGFGSRLNGVLQQALEKDFNTFSLGLNNAYLSDEAKIIGSPHKDIVKFKLNFNKSKNSDMVFMNDYHVQLFKPMEVMPRSHTFDLERDHRVTAQQAYRLLSGFSLEKNVLIPKQEGTELLEGQEDRRKIWLKIDLNVLDAYEQHPLRRFYPEYGYDLGATLDRYPFTNISSDSIRDVALEELSKGKLFKTEMHLYDQVFPIYIAANPHARSLDIFDKDLNIIPERQIFSEKIEKQPQAAEDLDFSAHQDRPWEQDIAEAPELKIGR